MKLLLMFGAILFFCLLCGIYTSARAVAHGTERVRSQWNPRKAEGMQAHEWNERCMQDLKGFFALYQSGALTREEFDQAKRHLLARMTACMKTGSREQIA